MYNEDKEHLIRTLTGIADNLPDLHKHGVKWQDIAVVIVSDGREKLNPTTAKYMEDDLKLYDPKLIVTKHLSFNVTMHLFEKSVELPKHHLTREYFYPLQVRRCGCRAERAGESSWGEGRGAES